MVNEFEMKAIAQAVLEFAKKTPEKIAVYFENDEYSYAQLASMSKKVALWIKSIGINEGSRIIVEASHTIEYVAFVYGTHLAKCVFVPMEKGSPDERLNDVMSEVSASLIITSSERENTNNGYAISNVWEEQILSIDETEYVYNLPNENDLVEILFTTGTTGKSKGVMVSHKNQITMGYGGAELVDLKSDNIWMITTPMNHAAGLRKMHMAFLLGSSVCLHEGFTNLKKFFEIIDKRKCTSLYMPPSAIHLMLSLAKKELANLDNQLRFIYSSSALYPQTDKDIMKELLPHVHMHNAYGGSECGVVCCLDFNSDVDIPGSVGKPHSLSKLFIVDDNGNEITNSSKENHGSIAVECDSVMLGYWNEPELTASVLKDGRLIMSDYGYFLDDGTLMLLGRNSDVINIGGFKVSPSEVEEIANTAECVDECLLILSGKDPALFLKLLVVIKEGYELDSKSITDLISTKLEPYKIPKRYQKVDEIYKTFNGKIDRKKMIAEYK